MSTQSILYQSGDKTITVLDIPRSIEEAQVLSTHQTLSSPSLADSKEHQPKVEPRRILSSLPLEKPYPSLEPKTAKAKQRLGVGKETLEELLLVRHLELALEEMTFPGPWCFPRLLSPPSPQKRKGSELEANSSPSLQKLNLEECLDPEIIFYQNPGLGILELDFYGKSGKIFVPPYATVLQCDITTAVASRRLQAAPKFNLIILDPPWPNRSARRKGSYAISDGVHGIQDMLMSIPINRMLAPDAVVGVWVTNKPIFRDLLLGPCGIFDSWGIGAIEEWLWVKTTIHGLPICALNSAWRKPYEILLVGRAKPDSSPSDMEAIEEERGQVKRRVIFGVPDLHSRKPNLRGLFEQLLAEEMAGELGKRDGLRYEALEIFARNCTAGWWSLGNEVLKFQAENFWS